MQVLDSDALTQSDPFVLLMDDRLNIANKRAIGGAHPHAGLETVTLVLEGELHDQDEGPMSAGDAVWMTAGRGIIHNEHVETEGRSRVLQLWVRLSKAERKAEPRFEIIRKDTVPVRREPGVVARVYSGRSGEAVSKTLNHVPVTLVDFQLEPASSVEQVLPAKYNGFLYVIDGSVRVDGGEWISKGQVAWFDRPAAEGDSVLRLMSRGDAARAVLYAGEPQNEPLIHHGPFVADDEPTLIAMFSQFRAGRFTPMSSLKPVG